MTEQKTVSLAEVLVQAKQWLDDQGYTPDASNSSLFERDEHDEFVHTEPYEVTARFLLNLIHHVETYYGGETLPENLCVPVIPGIASRILDGIEREEVIFTMTQWFHAPSEYYLPEDDRSCKTTCCLAGYARVLGDKLGDTMINNLGDYEMLGTAIFFVSTVNHDVPNFYGERPDAIEWLREQAALETTQ